MSANKMQRQVIELSGEWIDAAMSGEKRLTIREGNRDLSLTDSLLVNTMSNWCMPIQISHVELCVVSEVSDDIAREDGFKDTNELFTKLREYYPNIQKDNIVTVIRWEGP